MSIYYHFFDEYVGLLLEQLLEFFINKLKPKILPY